MTRAQALEALRLLVGMPMTDMFRYTGNQRFEFGPQVSDPDGEPGATGSDWGLVVACEWRLTGPGGFELNSRHFSDERKDGHAAAFYALLENKPPVVEHLDISDSDHLSMTLSQGYALAVEPVHGAIEPLVDQWIFLTPTTVVGTVFLTDAGYIQVA